MRWRRGEGEWDSQDEDLNLPTGGFLSPVGKEVSSFPSFRKITFYAIISATPLHVR